MMLSTIALIIAMASIYAYAAPERRTCALAALAFIIIFAAMTDGVHFVSLTACRQMDPAQCPRLNHRLSTGEWPTVALALDLLAWDFFLGLSMLFAARVFSGNQRARPMRLCMTATGALCLGATLGPVSGHMKLQYLGIVGYGFFLGITFALLARFFWGDG